MRMDSIDIFGNSNEEYIKLLAERKTAKIKNGIASIAKSGAKADIYFYELKDCLHVRLTDFYTDQPINANYHTTQEMISCYFICDVKSEGKLLIMDAPINHDIICIKQNKVVSYKIPPNTYIKTLYIGIPKNYFPSYYDGSETTMGRLMAASEFCMFQMETPGIKALCDKFIKVQANDDKRYNLSLAVAFELVSHLLELIKSRGGTLPTKALKEHHIKTVIKARTILLSNLKQTPNIEDISIAVASSSTQLRRNFKELFGESMYRYYKRYKLELCHSWLQEGSITVKEAAHKIGYKSSSKFTAEFKKQFGVLPKDLVSV